MLSSFSDPVRMEIIQYLESSVEILIYNYISFISFLYNKL